MRRGAGAIGKCLELHVRRHMLSVSTPCNCAFQRASDS